MFYRTIVIMSGALALAACTSGSDLDIFKSGPIMDTVRFESDPPGAEAKTSTGQTCRTPCALALPVDAPMTVTFTLSGYQPESENIEPIAITGSPNQFRPNPVVVELTRAAPPTKPAKKPAAPKKKVAKPSAARPKPATAESPPPVTAAPQQQQAPSSSPWPSTQPQR